MKEVQTLHARPIKHGHKLISPYTTEDCMSCVVTIKLGLWGAAVAQRAYIWSRAALAGTAREIGRSAAGERFRGKAACSLVKRHENSNQSGSYRSPWPTDADLRSINSRGMKERGRRKGAEERRELTRAGGARRSRSQSRCPVAASRRTSERLRLSRTPHSTGTSSSCACLSAK